jgi:hypothetical protein
MSDATKVFEETRAMRARANAAVLPACSCDAFADDPCPVHADENREQDERIRKETNTRLAQGQAKPAHDFPDTVEVFGVRFTAEKPAEWYYPTHGKRDYSSGAIRLICNYNSMPTVRGSHKPSEWVAWVAWYALSTIGGESKPTPEEALLSARKWMEDNLASARVRAEEAQLVVTSATEHLSKFDFCITGKTGQ